MRSHRFAPEEKNKENENDTDCLCGGGRSDADVARFRRFSSRADCASLSGAVTADQSNVTPVYWYRHRWYHHHWYRHHRHCWRGYYGRVHCRW